MSVKASYKSALAQVEAGVITTDMLDKMIEGGLVSMPSICQSYDSQR